MKRLLTLALPLLALAGCHFGPVGVCHYDSYGDYHCHENSSKADHHDSTTVVYTSANNGGGSNNNIIVIEEEALSYCEEEPPFFHEPDWCTVGEETCCTWSAAPWGVWETYCYIDHCGWELVLVEEDYSY